MITIQLTKLETAVDQVRKSYTQLVPADQTLLATALSLTGRHAIAIYEGEQYVWPEDNDRLTRAMVSQVNQVNEAIEHNTPKRVSKTAPEDEPVMITVGLMPNLTAGEELLSKRDDLKAILSDALQDGVEYSYNPTDLGWQWALDRANWNTITGHEVSRRIRVKASFTEGAVGIELGIGGKKRPTKGAAAKAEAVIEDKVEDIPLDDLPEDDEEE